MILICFAKIGGGKTKSRITTSDIAMKFYMTTLHTYIEITVPQISYLFPYSLEEEVQVCIPPETGLALGTQSEQK